MNAISAKNARTAEANTRRLMVRMNATMFHCLGAALLLESAATPTRHDEAGREHEERVRWLREYAGAVWPEFAWDAACRAIAAAGSARESFDGGKRAGLATDDTTTEHKALFYRALGRCADDPALRTRLQHIAELEEGRAARGSGTAVRALAAMRRFQRTRAQVKSLRDCTVRRAYEVLQQHWADTPPFSEMTYGEFIARAHLLMAPHLQLDWTRRALLRAWLQGTRTDATQIATRKAVVRGRNTPGPATLYKGCSRMPAYALPHAVGLR